MVRKDTDAYYDYSANQSERVLLRLLKLQQKETGPDRYSTSLHFTSHHAHITPNTLVTQILIACLLTTELLTRI